MKTILLIPLLGLLVGVYALIVQFSGPEGTAAFLAHSALQIGDLPALTGSGGTAPWVITVSDLFVTIGLIFLGIEMAKATNTRGWSLGNHGLSLVVLIGGIVLFVMVPGYTTNTFFFLILMAFVDVTVGSLVTTNSAKRDIGLGPSIGD